ncbi:hypothetical protein EAD89_11650, partial [Micromonospora sp. BL4]
MPPVVDGGQLGSAGAGTTGGAETGAGVQPPPPWVGCAATAGDDQLVGDAEARTPGPDDEPCSGAELRSAESAGDGAAHPLGLAGGALTDAVARMVGGTPGVAGGGGNGGAGIGPGGGGGPGTGG